MKKVELEFYGPFGWGGDDKIPSIYDDSPITSKSGVYLWTVLRPDGDELVYYVGQTRRSFAKRFEEHENDQSTGWYHVYDPDGFALGEKKLLWDGVYGHDIEPDEEFKSSFNKLEPVVVRFKKLLRFHLAPVSPEQAGTMDLTEFLKRVEAGLAHHFYQQPGVVGGFQDEEVRYLEQCSLPRRLLRDLTWPPQDPSTRVVCRAQGKIRCFPDEILV